MLRPANLDKVTRMRVALDAQFDHSQNHESRKVVTRQTVGLESHQSYHSG